MLSLTRRVGQRLVIGDGPDAVVVEVVRFGNGQVQLGITAPPSVRVDREEIAARRLHPTTAAERRAVR